MTNNTSRPSIFQRFLFLAILVPFLYWLYLAFVTQLVIIHDAHGYQSLGRMLVHQGWTGYFKHGPSREPFYPFLVSLAMDAGNARSILYFNILVPVQVCFLLFAQLLFFRLLKRLNLAPGIRFVFLLAFGFSPAIVNTAMSHFSEVVTLPFPLAIVLTAAWGKRIIERGDTWPAVLNAVFLGLFFALLTSIKGVYEFVFILFVLIIGLLWWHTLNPRTAQSKHALRIYLLTAFIVFHSLIVPYKMQNKKHNGQYTLTDRGAWVLYGAFAHRAQELSKEKWLAAIASIPDIHYCNTFLGQDNCAYWGFKPIHTLAEKKVIEVTQAVGRTRKDRELTRQAIAQFFSQPLQSTALIGIDILKLFFWESTRVGFVVYPDWLDHIYDFFPLKLLWEWSIGLLSLCGYFWLWRLLIGKSENKPDHDTLTVLGLLLFFITVHNGFYGLVSAIEKRHALPLASLQLTAIALFVQSLLEINRE